MRRTLAAALLLMAAATPPTAPTASVTVIVQGVHSAGGHVLVAICPRATFLMPHCAYKGRSPSQVGDVRITVSGIPPGVYAAQAYQDEADVGHIRRTLLGVPKDGLGFSNDARMMFGPPRFNDAAFAVGPNGGTIHLRLRYY